MEAGATTIMTAKLPIHNLGEYDLWLMRIEQYFLMTDYSLWEVIKNGNKVLMRIVGTHEETYEPTSVEEKLDRRNEMKARGTLLMTLPNKYQLKFHSYQDAKLLMKAIEKSTSSTNEADTTASGVSTAHTQGTIVNFTSVDNLINAMICAFFASQPNSPQLAKEDLEQIDPNDLEEIDLHWKMVMLTIRARRFMERTGRNLDMNGRRIGFDNSKVECFNCHKNGHFARECKAPKNQDNKAGEEIPTNYAFMTLTSSKSSSSSESESVEERLVYYKKNKVVLTDKINVLNLDVKLRAKVLADYTKNLEQAEKERDELKLTLKKLQNSFKALNNLLDSQTVKTIDVNYKGMFSTEKPNPVMKNNFSPLIIEDWHSDDESEEEISPTIEVKTVKPSIERLNIFEHLQYVCDKKDIRPMRNNSNRVNKKNFANKLTHPHPKRGFVPRAVLTRSGKINTTGASVTTTGRPVNNAGSKSLVSQPRIKSKAFQRGHSKDTRSNNKFSANKNSIFNNKVNTIRVDDSTARDTIVGNPQQKEYKEKGVIDSGCSRNMTRNKCYLNDFEAYDGGFISFRDGNGRISGKGKIKTEKLDFDDVYSYKELKYNLFGVSQMCDKKNNVLSTNTECLVLSSNFNLLDESQVLLRVPRKDNIYSVDLKSVVPTGVTDDFSRFSWVLIFATKGENSGILKTFITGIENQLDFKVKVIRCDNETKFKNSVINQICKDKGIKREFSVARTPQQNRVAERRNMTLIEAARTMLVDSKLPTTFWSEAVNTACFVLNRALVTKPYNKIPYELIRGRPPLDFVKPFGCLFTILNTRDNLGKFEGKADEGYFVGYSVVSKDMRVFNKRTRIVEETLNIIFQENEPNVKENGPGLLFDIDSLTISMNYVPVVAGNQTNGNKDSTVDVGKKALEVDESEASDNVEKNDQVPRIFRCDTHFWGCYTNSTNLLNAISTLISTVGHSRALNDAEPSYPDDPLMPHLEDIFASPSEGIFTDSSFDDEGVTRSKVHKNSEAHALVSYIQKQQRNNHKDFQHCLFACFLSQVEAKKISQALEDKSWVDTMQEELLNKKDEKGVIVRNKARLVTQGHRQEEGINYEEVFAPVARIEAIRIFLAFASYIGFIVYQMNVKSAFLYGTIDEEVYVIQPFGFVYPKFPNKVYKVVKALYGLH
nr:hypothetical protein [Tanacetum cinerariifolium]